MCLTSNKMLASSTQRLQANVCRYLKAGDRLYSTKTHTGRESAGGFINGIADWRRTDFSALRAHISPVCQRSSWVPASRSRDQPRGKRTYHHPDIRYSISASWCLLLAAYSPARRAVSLSIVPASFSSHDRISRRGCTQKLECLTNPKLQYCVRLSVVWSAVAVCDVIVLWLKSES